MYRARREPDGTYSIFAVPTFGEVPKGVKNAPFDIGKKWLQDALANLKARESEGYLPPLHFNHHGMDATAKAGHFRGHSVGQVTLKGAKKWAIFTDLVLIPEGVFALIWSNKFPFRSVEIHNYEDREIETLALLDDDAPFFKFPLLNSSTIELESGTPEPSAANVPAAFAGLTEDSMKLVLAGDPKSGFTLHDDKGDEVTAVESLAGASFTVELSKGYHFAEEDKDDGKEDTEEKLKAAIAKLQAKLKKMQGAKAQKDDPDGAPADEKDTKAAKASALDDPVIAAQFAARDEQIARLERRDAERESKDAAEARFVKATKDLDGWHLSESTIEKLRTFASKGEEETDLFVETIKEAMPRETFSAAELEAGAHLTNESEAVSAYASQGPEALAAAREADKTFDQLVASGAWTEADRPHFIKSQMRSFAGVNGG